MDNNIINEIENAVEKVLLEQVSKVNRHEFSRIQFKIDELQLSLNDTIKEFRKLEDSVPNGLKTITNGRLNTISNNLQTTQKVIGELKEKIRTYKKKIYQNQVIEKDNKNGTN